MLAVDNPGAEDVGIPEQVLHDLLQADTVDNIRRVRLGISGTEDGPCPTTAEC